MRLNELVIDQEIKKEIQSSLNLIGGDEFKTRLICLSDTLSEILTRTLGPYAHTTVIDNGSSFPYPTKDGWTVLKNLSIGGSGINHTLYQFIRQVSYRLASEVGDGTTTAVVAANEFIKLISQNIYYFKDIRQADLVDLIKDMKNLIVEKLEKSNLIHRINPDGDFHEIFNIAHTSSNRNNEIAEMLQEIYYKTKNPNIYIDITNDLKTSYDLQIGYKLDANLIAPNIYINSEDGTYKSSEPHLFAIFDHNVGYNTHGAIVNAIMTCAYSRNSVLVIIAPHFDSMLINSLIEQFKALRQNNQVPNLMMVEANMVRRRDKNYISDFATLVEADIIGDDKVRMFNTLVDFQNKGETPTDPIQLDIFNKFQSNNFINYAVTGLGRNSNIVISPKSSFIFIQNYNKESQRYKNLINTVTIEYNEEKKKAEMSTDTLGSRFLEVNERYVKLLGNMGIIHIGGESDLEKLCLRDSVDDAVKACKSAYEKGYVMGLNLAILYAIEEAYNKVLNGKNIEESEKEVKLQCRILELFSKVFTNTSIKVMHNKYPNDVDNHTPRWFYPLKDDTELFDPEGGCEDDYYEAFDCIRLCVMNKTGYNIVTEKPEVQDELSVVNSVDTDIQVLNATVSILSLILTSDQLISINKQGDFKETHARLVKQKSDEYASYADAVLSKLLKEPTIKNFINAINQKL